ncbi:MAG: hypothetical protein MJ168_03770 [Clostridia bacterium]|nr:hypothetical protein [Clostridia bacterium]
MDRDVLLKKNIIGGFDRKQVLDYISQLQSSCNNRKTREEIEDMRLRVASLREIIKEKDKQIAALTTEIDEINNLQLPGAEQQDDFDILQRSNEQIEQARTEAETITSKVSDGIKSKNEKISNLFARISAINEEITKFSDSIGVISDKLDDVPFEPVTEKDIENHELPKFDFDKVMEAIAEEEAQLAAEAEARAKAEQEERIRIEEEIRAKLEAEAAEKARIEAETKAKAEAEEKARIEAEEKARIEAEEKARVKAEMKAKAEAEEKARIEAEMKAKAEAEEKARVEAESKAKEEAENKAKAEADAKAAIQEEKFNTLFAKLTVMTDEINKMNGNISDVSERLNQIPATEKSDTEAIEKPVSESIKVYSIAAEQDDTEFENVFDEIESVIKSMPDDNELIAPSVETEEPVSENNPIEEAEPVEIEDEPEEEIEDEIVVSEELPTQAEAITESEKKIEEIRTEKEKLEKVIAEKEPKVEKPEESSSSSDTPDDLLGEELYFTLEI